ncbi:DUF1707 domain-containing protein [Kutzneria viridogrisea]|nr:DUF1707 domain-containing protein [Kutzneria albida]MBA8931375.1 hypothetical protein [Kutzneria viridogrisea]
MTTGEPFGQKVDNRELRVSDSEREHVVALLQKAIGRGLLTLEEFTERTDVALAARTRGELNAVLIDLPGMVHPDAPVRSGPSAVGASVSGDTVELVGGSMSPLTRSGRWVVPRNVVVRAKFGTTDLDFSAAQFEHAEVSLRVYATGGPVLLRLPETAAVTIADLDTKWGATVHDRVGFQGRAGNPHFTISGEVSMAPLTIKGPRR